MKAPPISKQQRWEQEETAAHYCPSNNAEPVIVDRYVVSWVPHRHLPLLSQAKVAVEEKYVARVVP